jgi:hypothetical protein
MSIIRIRKEEKYSIIANSVLQNKALTWEARGIMSYLLSKPDGWECRNYDLVNQGPASEHIIRRVLKELQEAGYIHRYRKSQGRGKIEWVTEIYETPELNTVLRNGTFSSLENFETESFNLEKSPDIVSTDSQKVLKTENKDLTANSQNSQTNGNAPSSPDHRADQEERDNLNALCDSIAKVTGVNIATAHKTTIDELKRLALSFYGLDVRSDDLKNFSSWWYDYSWQGKKGQSPTLKQVGDSWGQFEAQKVVNVPTISTDGGFYV